MRLHGRTLVRGSCIGELALLDSPLSFWGGFDPVAGIIIDKAHPQVGTSLGGLVVAMAGSRGSSGTPGVLGESLRRGTGPAGLLITKADINLVAGAMVAGALYGSTCPVVVLDAADFAQLPRSGRAEVHPDGAVEVHAA